MREPRISPYNDDDRWAVIASLRGRYNVSYGNLGILLRQAERMLVTMYRDGTMEPETLKAWTEGSRLDWRILLATLVEESIKKAGG